MGQSGINSASDGRLEVTGVYKKKTKAKINAYSYKEKNIHTSHSSQIKFMQERKVGVNQKQINSIVMTIRVGIEAAKQFYH